MVKAPPIDWPMPTVTGFVHGAEPVQQGARRQLLPHFGLGGLRRRHDRGEGQPIGVVEGTVAHAEVVDGDEDPAAVGMPGGLRADA